jgi:hypothetical protein
MKTYSKVRNTVLSVLLFTSLLFGIASIASAASYWYPSIGWSSVQHWEFPHSGNTSALEETDSFSNRTLKPMSSFKFSSQSVQYYKDIAVGTQPHGWYTHDISTTESNTNLNTNLYNLYSTLPGAYFDIDDDPEPNGNGYNDESEVTCTSPSSLVAETDYRFESYFTVNSNSSPTTIDHTSQTSWYDPINSEYQTITYETHVSRSFYTN